jgi:hypothetical protein
MDAPNPADPTAVPLDAAAALAWMREHGETLRALIAEETEDEDGGPASDGAIRGNLRFVAAAIEATAAPGIAELTAGLDEDLPLRFVLGEDLVARHAEAGAGAIALEEHLQHGTSPGRDPSLDAGLDRRVRISGWIQLFLVQLEERLGPAGDGFAAAVSSELDRRHRDLARLIFSLDRLAKQHLRARLPGAPTTEALDEVGQAAVVQANARMLVEAIATTLAARAESPR